jgi:hypothetical protein
MAYRNAGTMAQMSDQLSILTHKVANLPIPKPMGWGQWLWEKVAIPGGMILNLALLGKLAKDTTDTFRAPNDVYVGFLNWF